MTKRLPGDYFKNSFNIDKLIGELDEATAKAKQLHKNKNEPFPKNTGTHVYKLVEKLNEKP